MRDLSSSKRNDLGVRRKIVQRLWIDLFSYCKKDCTQKNLARKLDHLSYRGRKESTRKPDVGASRKRARGGLNKALRAFQVSVDPPTTRLLPVGAQTQFIEQARKILMLPQTLHPINKQDFDLKGLLDAINCQSALNCRVSVADQSMGCAQPR